MLNQQKRNLGTVLNKFKTLFKINDTPECGEKKKKTQEELDARDIVNTFKNVSVFFKYQKDLIAKRNEIYSL